MSYEGDVEIPYDVIEGINTLNHSELLDTLAWTHFHHSILEHANLTYLIKGTSRGVLQEHARHRIQAISVRSTRYTMSSVINAFVASTRTNYARKFFMETVNTMDLFITQDKEYNKILLSTMFEQLRRQFHILGADQFFKIAIAKSSLEKFSQYELATSETFYEMLEAGKKKRNVGDAFKHIVTDNWKVDMVVTFNLRSLKNYFTLRDSGAAYFQIQWLAQAMKEVTPSKYLDLIIKSN